MSSQGKLDLGMQVMIHSVGIHLLCEENLWPGPLQWGRGNSIDSELSFLCFLDFLAGDYQFLADINFMLKLSFYFGPEGRRLTICGRLCIAQNNAPSVVLPWSALPPCAAPPAGGLYNPAPLKSSVAVRFASSKEMGIKVRCETSKQKI